MNLGLTFLITIGGRIKFIIQDLGKPKPNFMRKVRPKFSALLRTRIGIVQFDGIHSECFNFCNSMESTANVSQSGGEDETTSRRRRRSRWDPPSSESIGRNRKSRWADDEPKLPNFIKDLTEFDPEIQILNIRLLEISRML